MAAHTDAVWANLYVRRWLAAPLVMPDGSQVKRERGTPQGAPVSPVLANLFLHYAFDNRMVEVGLRLHLDKTRIVYCKDGDRRRSFEHTAFTFLGYTFRARKNRSRRGNLFLSFEPGISREALTRIGREARSWRLHRRADLTVHELARRMNPVIGSWINYYGRFRPWELNGLLTRINTYLVRWIRKKCKRLAAQKRACSKMQEIAQRYPACSRTGASPRTPRRSDDQSDKSRVTRDCYARFCEGRGVRSPSATRPFSEATDNSFRRLEAGRG
ncbi:group II intron maturase-specific domain-containing protein [Streptomyces sp. WAC08241]|uniref:group II intron maturase-specific domain-containing protein n=1 Tax=Streptomyces sp. WAC08241 TaxID=2487421 RepID=UPI0021AF1A7D|nr:group II intron maturase-specific domain-containing protein [Streptomyces sp. WAC08241]